MITERKEQLADLGAESFIEMMIEKYAKAFLGDRFEEVENAENIYGQEGRQPAQIGGEVQGVDQFDIGR